MHFDDIKKVAKLWQQSSAQKLTQIKDWVAPGCLGCIHYHGNGIFGPSCFGDDLNKKLGNCEHYDAVKEPKKLEYGSSSSIGSSIGSSSSIGFVSPSLAEEFPSLVKEPKKLDKPKPVRKVLKPAAGVGRKLELD